MKTNKKARTLLGVCIILGAGLISVRAAQTPARPTGRMMDTPAQAAARAALQQKMNQLDNVQTPTIPRGPRMPVTVTPSGIVVKHRAIYAAARLEKC